jgi:hypothetical protein
MANLRATSFWNAQITGPGPVNLYTVPTGHRIILREIIVYNHAASNNTATVALASGSTLLSRVLTAAGSGGATLFYDMWAVLNAAELLQGYTDSGKHLTIVLSGSLLYI